MTEAPVALTLESLTELDRLVERALVTGDDSALTVLGYGEITTVLAWPEPSGPWACKRLPIFETRPRFDAYAEVFYEYLERVRASGTPVVDSTLHCVEREDGRYDGYCVQPVLPGDTLARNVLAFAAPDDGRELLRRIVARIVASCTPEVGIDGHLTNWSLHGDTVALLDVTTPLLRDAAGREGLDIDVFVAALPAPLRRLTKRFLIGGILDHYYDVRTTVLDLAANLQLAGLVEWRPALLDIVASEFGLDITEREAAKYYRSDSRLWAFLLWARRVDRVWQRRVRRRRYPFLLPGPVDRHW